MPVPEETQIPVSAPDTPPPDDLAAAAPSSDEAVIQKQEAERVRKHVKRLVANMTTAPGVYKMLDGTGEVLYVGKAKSLKKRVSSYFRVAGHTPKTERMVAKIRDIQVIGVGSEVEALMLETNLIKQHRPHYNILMRDDKNVAYLKVTHNETFPRIFPVRSVVNDGARYFGPYLSASTPMKSLEFLKRLFPFRTCTGLINVVGPARHVNEAVHVETHNIPRTPCLLYHIKRCVAPCIGKVEVEDYARIIKDVEQVLEGKVDHLIEVAREEMQEAAIAKQFERAAKLRDRVQALEQMLASQKQIVSGVRLGTSQDILNFVSDSGIAACVLLRIRDGRLIDSQQTSFRVNPDVSGPDDVLDAILSQYYAEAIDLPDEILVPARTVSAEALETLLSERRGKKVSIRVPQRGDAKQQLLLARQNAGHHLEEIRIKWMNEEKRTVSAMRELGQRLNVPEPRRIECYDISHIQGTSKVGSMVVFLDGVPAKSQYRRFHIKDLAEGESDDFASLAEVLRRRLTYLLEEERQRQLNAPPAAVTTEEAAEPAAPTDEAEQPVPETKSTVRKVNRSKLRAIKKQDDESFKALPDLIIIDGGKGQLSAVKDVAAELGLHALAIVSLAKREEEIFVPGLDQAIRLEPYSEALYLIQRIRDEAHRFAITFHRAVRAKKMVRSRLDEVPGLGPTAKKKLLNTFGSLRGVMAASESDVAAVVGSGLAARLKELL